MIWLEPGGLKLEIKSLESHHETVENGSPFVYLSLNVKGVRYTDIAKGSVCGNIENPPKFVQEFTSEIFFVQRVGKIKNGYNAVLHCHAARVPCKIDQVLAIIDKKTKKNISKNPEEVVKGDLISVRIVPLKPIVLEEFLNFTKLGRLIIRDSNTTVAFGVVKSIVPRFEQSMAK